MSDGLLARPSDVARVRRLLPAGILLGAFGVARIVGVELHIDDTLAAADNLGTVPFLLMCGVFTYAMSLVFEWPGATARGEEVLAALFERFAEPGSGRVTEDHLAYVVALHGPAAIAAVHPDLSRWVDDEISWHAQRR